MTVIHDTEWLAQLKAGDKVYVSGNNAGRIVKISRITKTQIIVEYKSSGVKPCSIERFRRSNGISIGGNVWNHNLLCKLTPELREELYLKKLQNKAAYLIKNIEIPKTKAELLEFNNIISKFVKIDCGAIAKE